LLEVALPSAVTSKTTSYVPMIKVSIVKVLQASVASADEQPGWVMDEYEEVNLYVRI
jgi:hypothetical protein